ncbi:MAG TPA: hypothetical protein GXZ98_03110 [Firmicutes bacterium]|nr:hypothetical protein [Bacillota bacterium]
MKSQDYFMVLDVGTGAGRVVLFNETGRLIGKSYQEWSYRINGGAYEFSAEEFWLLLKSCMKEVIKKTGINPKAIKAITSTSQREGIVLLDQDGNYLYAGPNQDRRGEEYNDDLAGKDGALIYRKTGHWPEPFFAPGRLFWFREHKKEVYDRIAQVLLLNDWVLYELTGEKYSEPTNACETLFYNLETGSWDQELLADMGLSTDILAPIKRNGEFCGYVQPKLVEELGLSAKTPVIIGVADTQAALLGNGQYTQGEVGIVAGSTCPVQLITDRLIIDDQMRTWSCAFISEHKYVLEANARATGLLMRWMRDSFYQSGSVQQSFALMEEEAATIPPGSHGVMAYLGAVISDVKDKKVNSMRYICGLPQDYFGTDGRGILMRSAIENVAFAIKGNIELLYEISRIKPIRLVITGGNTKNRLFLEILAATLDLPLYVATQDETTALGAAICAAVGAGCYDSFETAVNIMGSRIEVIEPNKEWKKEYVSYYQRWKQNFEKMRGI